MIEYAHYLDECALYCDIGGWYYWGVIYKGGRYMIENNYKELVTAIIIQAVKDYCHARRTWAPNNYQAISTIIEVDRFFKESYIPYIVLDNPSDWWDDIKERLRLNKFIMRRCSDVC